MIADDRDDADDLRCNASDRIAGSSYVRSSKKIEFWDFFGVFVSVFSHFVVQVCWMIADDRDDTDDL